MARLIVFGSMSAQQIAANPAALTNIGASLGEAARALPLSGLWGVPVGDAAADAVLREFTARWTAYLQALNEITQLTARQANLTALAFRLAGA
jgi:hypothetical protein